MKLTGVRINGFKNIRDIELKFRDTITVLIADNGFGKSNIIDAIDFAFCFIHSEPEARTEMMSRAYCVPFHREIPSDRFSADFMFEDEASGKEQCINYGFEFLWQKDCSEGKITKEWLGIRGEDKSKECIRIIDREDKALYKNSKSGNCDKEISIADNDLVLNRLMEVEGLIYSDLIKKMNQATITVIRPEDILLQNCNMPEVPDDSISDIAGIDDLPRFLYWLKVREPNEFSCIVSAMQLQFEDIESIEVFDRSNTYSLTNSEDTVGKSGQLYSLIVKKENLDRSIDYANLSKGELYTLLLLAKYVASEVRGDVLIAIDEPENSIHPKQYSAHAQTIAPIIMDDCNVLIASQSPFFVQYYEPENYYIGRPYNNGIANFARVDKNCMSRLEEDARSCSETPGVFVFDLLSGSEDEIEQLAGYLEQSEVFEPGGIFGQT